MENRAEQRRRAVLEALARAMEPLIAAKAKENQREHGGTAPGRGKTLSQKSVKVIDTKKEAAALARRNLTSAQRIEVSMKREPLIAARAKASYEANVGRPKKSCQKSDKISRVDTKREAAKLAGVSHPGATSQKSANLSKRKNLSQKSVEGLDQGSTPTPVGSGTPQHGGQGERTTDGEAHGQGQG